VSQQVKSLEEHTGVRLVIRQGREVRLTEDGAALAWHLLRGFSAMGEGVEALTRAAANRPVQVTMSPAFAVSWLMPRLRDFQNQHPQITLMLNPTAELIDPTSAGMDLAIRYGDGDWPNMEVALLLLSDMLVVGARELIGNRDISDTSILVDMPWLQELGTNEVAEWMERHGLVNNRQMKITHMPGNLIMDAVRRGDGLTYTARCFVDEDIRSGKLVELSSERGVGGYYIVTRGGVLRPPVKAFVKWLKAAVRTDACYLCPRSWRSCI
jgi:DNA-binding transcriptional LysR family regulator